MALMDDIKKSLQSGFKLPQFGQSQRLEELQRASTGRLARETGPKTTYLAEQVAATAAEQQRKEDVLAGQVAAEELTMAEKEQQERFRQQNKLIDERVLNARQDMQNKVSNILQEYAERTGEIQMREDSAKTQFALGMMRMSNDDYLDRLETEGAAARLNETAAFEWELTQSIFKDELDLLRNDLAFQAAMNADEREFKEYMAEMDLMTALELAQDEAAALQTLAKYEAIGDITTGVVRAGKGIAENMSDGTTKTTLGSSRTATDIGIEEQSGLDTGYLPGSDTEIA